jgi:hypothetical protein
MKSVAFIFFSLLSTATLAQFHNGDFSIGWNTLIPLSDKDYTSTTSSAGARIGFTKVVNDNFGLGLEGGFNTLSEYVPPATYEYPGGAITTDMYNYLYYFTILGKVQYYIVQGKRFIPYASLGMGMAFSEYKIYYNVYDDSDSNQSFVVRPEVGTLFRINDFSKWGFKSSLSYEYAANKSDQFQVGNFSGISFQIGVVLFTD